MEEYYCPNCGATLNYQFTFREHDEYHTCSWCNTKLHLDDSADEYEIIDEKDYKYKCPWCRNLLSNQLWFNGHDDYFTCSICDTKLHKDYVTGEYEQIDENDYRYKCPNCDEWLIDQQGYLDFYEDYTCSACGAKLHRDFSISPYSVVKDDEDIVYTSGEDDNDDIEYASREDDNDDIEYASREDENNDIDNFKSMPSEQTVEPPNLKLALKALLIIFVLVIGLLLALFFYFENAKLIESGVNSYALKGIDYNQAINILENKGFTNVTSYPEYDLDLDNIQLEGTVKEVTINGDNYFTQKEKYSYDSDVKIIYHVLREIPISISSDDAKKTNYRVVFEKLRGAGFVNITLNKKDDLILGLFIKDGSVDSIIVDGKDCFQTSDLFRPDAKIEIAYHAYK